MEQLTTRTVSLIADEILCRPDQVVAAAALLDEGKSVPFVARYRKEATGGLTDAQLRTLEERLLYLRELDERRAAVTATIEAQGKLTDELKRDLEAAQTKQALEDLYAPFRSKRRTRAAVAREAGLEPLADRILETRADPEGAAADFVSAEKGVAGVAEALSGARDILAERFALQPEVRQALRDLYTRRGEVVARVREGKEVEGEKYADYFDFRERLADLPSHRALALLRGRRDDYLDLTLELPAEEEGLSPHPAEALVARFYGISDNTVHSADVWLLGVCRWAWRVKMRTSLQTELLEALRERAEETAIGIFGHNLRDLLLAAPAGHRVTVGLDPGFRTGVKMAVVDETGKVVHHDVLQFHAAGAGAAAAARAKLADVLKRYRSEFVAIGNGTASRETVEAVGEVLAGEPSISARRVVVSEAGASVYSASELAEKELPGLDVSYRGAVSIARRLQDPLAELVKIDPKAIGVGQYQHDVDAGKLERRLDAVVEDCVNFVGVDVNTASVELLARVAGLSRSVAREIVTFRETHGLFANRNDLKRVPLLGAVRFEQCAGFLRISDGTNPLDRTGVHPEAYPVVERLVAASGVRTIDELMGNVEKLKALRARDFVDDRFGLPTVLDILKELEKPGRDPRAVFTAPVYDDSIRTMEDLKPGMELEGTVTNVAAFGAFVDLGVHENGLVHISDLADTFVKDPRDVVRVGMVVKVHVLDVDLKRRRIALTMRTRPKGESGVRRSSTGRREEAPRARTQTALGAAFAALKKR